MLIKIEHRYRYFTLTYRTGSRTPWNQYILSKTSRGPSSKKEPSSMSAKVMDNLARHSLTRSMFCRLFAESGWWRESSPRGTPEVPGPNICKDQINQLNLSKKIDHVIHQLKFQVQISTHINRSIKPGTNISHIVHQKFKVKISANMQSINQTWHKKPDNMVHLKFRIR
jgi:hypothetical protein